MGSVAAYAIGHITIKNSDKWVEYCKQVPATLSPWNAELLFRAKKLTTFSGEHSYDHVVVICFPDSASMEGWFKSGDYQRLIPLRDQAADVVLIAYES